MMEFLTLVFNWYLENLEGKIPASYLELYQSFSP